MYNLKYIAVKILNFIFGIIVLFLGLRIILRLFGASSEAPIVSWIFNISQSLISPFAGMFEDLQLGNGSLDISALVALVFYVIIFSIIISFIKSITSTRSETLHHAH